MLQVGYHSLMWNAGGSMKWLSWIVTDEGCFMRIELSRKYPWRPWDILLGERSVSRSKALLLPRWFGAKSVADNSTRSCHASMLQMLISMMLISMLQMLISVLQMLMSMLQMLISSCVIDCLRCFFASSLLSLWFFLFPGLKNNAVLSHVCMIRVPVHAGSPVLLSTGTCATDFETSPGYTYSQVLCF